jgi:hypothetical protein
MTRAPPLASSIEGVSVVMPTNDPMAVMPSLGLAMDGFMTANDRRFEALGWSTDPWEEWKRRTKRTSVQLLRTLRNVDKHESARASPLEVVVPSDRIDPLCLPTAQSRSPCACCHPCCHS